jgi:hypothetical protein
MVSALIGCTHEPDRLRSIDPTPTTAPATAPEEAEPVIPEVTINPTEEAGPVTPEVTTEPMSIDKTFTGETKAEELSKDIDLNGVMDIVRILEREDGSVYIQIIFNGEDIYHCEWSGLRLLSVDVFEYLDLDRDGENEIFITANPSVNSRPLIEILTLKQTDGRWSMLEIPLNENGNNCFPFSITRGKEEFDFIISSEYTEKQIHFDASSFYEDGPDSNPNSIHAYRNNHYKAGDQVAYISSWGIWETQTGSYDGYNCIIAQQGMEAPYGNYLGRVIIYYDYDANRSIEVLNIEYVL